MAFCSCSSQDNPSDKDINQGTLVVFNLDPSVSNDDLRVIFGAYGEVKEVIIYPFCLFVTLLPCHIFSDFRLMVKNNCRYGKHLTKGIISLLNFMMLGLQKQHLNH